MTTIPPVALPTNEPIRAIKAEEEPGSSAPARTVNYPRVDEDALARRIFDREYEREPGKWATRLAAGGATAAVLGGVAAVMTKTVPGMKGLRMLPMAGMAAAVGAGIGAFGIGHFLTRRSPEWARDHAATSLDFEARSRPSLPPVSAVPTERVGMPGEIRQGITGSTVGGIVQLKQSVASDVTTRSTTTRNQAGEPTIMIGSASGESVTTEKIVRNEDAQLNSLGLGRVLYDAKGYGSMEEAFGAYDGRHAAAVVKDGDRYYLVDADAESWSALQDRSYAMSVGDERVKTIFANKGVYYPTSVGDAAGDSRLFLFAQDQDIDRTLPQDLTELRDRPIGTYETNSVPPRNAFDDRYQLHVGSFHMGDEYAGPGFTDRREAIQFMTEQGGQQALVQSGDRFFVANLHRRNGSGEEVSLDGITNNTPQGSAILGLRTGGESSRIELIEDEGGLYAPVEDWWVRINAER